MSDLIEMATQYTVCALPLDDPNASSFTLTVEWRGGDKWAVMRGPFAYCRKDADLDRPHGEYEPRPSSRDVVFLRKYRFSLPVALEMARKIAPKVTVNGHTVADALAWRAEKHGGES